MLILVPLVVFLGGATSQNVYECPHDWFSNGLFCYKFERDIPETYDNARSKCSIHGAGVLSVESMGENTFIVQWLQNHDPFKQEWYTSGVRDTSAGASTDFVWESSGQRVDVSLNVLWLQPPVKTTNKGVIIYAYGNSGLGWSFADPSKKRPFICKIPVNEAYRILQRNRGFDYGLDVENMNAVEKGPRFIVQPKSIVVVTETGDKESVSVSLECVVQANPPATYKWFRGQNFETEVTKDLDARYSITNGKLDIEHPKEAADSNLYRCVAENKFGRVISNFVELTFGSLGEFSNVQDVGTRAKAYDGATVKCSDILFKPAVSYQWSKGIDKQFVRSDLQPHMFVSNNGNLYFSEVTRVDEAEYQCTVTLTGSNLHTIGTTQPPMRTSMFIPLVVDDQASKVEWGPEIQNDFIDVFPSSPLRGNDVRLECFAYGTSNTDFYYRWSRDDKPMPESVQTYDHNRVLIIKHAQLDDSGIYKCSVGRGAQVTDSKTILLNIGARPYFVGELQDQHADIGSHLTWICNARGSPEPTYKWYKNGRLLSTVSASRIKVQMNVLKISQLDPELHNGMYQCGAQNSFGESLSTAQLRVLAFAPNLSKNPPPRNILAPEQGNITIRCQPEGAPFPTIVWFKGGSPIQSDETKYMVFDNGNLHIRFLSTADKGVYICKATNVYGEAEAATTLDITKGTVITTPPADVTVLINKTTFIACEASYPRGTDTVYEWTFNGFLIDLDEEEGFYRQVQDSAPGRNGLYIINAQFKHEGIYTCTARSSFNFDSKSAYLKVHGPPQQPAGVHVLSETVSVNSTVVVWTQGSGSGGTVSVHFVQASNEFEPHVWKDLLSVKVKDSLKQNTLQDGRHSVLAVGLNPGTGYRFRVVAQNEFGRGVPSDPSTYVQTLSAPPCVAPTNLRGGGGSVGDLTIRWDPLHRSEYGARTAGYRVFWRRKDAKVRDAMWAVEVIQNPTADHIVELVGATYFYLLYETKIQAFNEMGFGPNSSIVEVYSAEDLPIAVPQKVRTKLHNSTAVAASWEPVTESREYTRGRILGYQINYWNLADDPDEYIQFIRYYGSHVSNGLVIGLPPNIRVVVDIQVYNSAGLGPRSNTYIMETTSFASLHYPQEVHISSAGGHRAHVWWRGLTLITSEEAIKGYNIWLWRASEDFSTAKLIYIKGRVYRYTLTNLTDNFLYAMRIASESNGGSGKKTPTLYFTTEGQILIDHRLAEKIEFLGDGHRLHCSLPLMLLSCIMTMLLLFVSS